MKQIIILSFSLFFVHITHSQLAQADTYKTSKGLLTIQPIIHASMYLKWHNKIIYVDPSRLDKWASQLPKSDVVFITDIHGDHLNLKSLKQILKPSTVLIMPLAAQLKLKGSGLTNKIITLRNGERKRLMDMRIKAIPMYNLPESNKSRHIKGRGNGYVLNLGGKRLYISGDTADIIEMRALKNIDIAFVCMNLPYTMSVEQAADAVLAFKPKNVYPYHYRGKGGFSDVNKFKTLVNKSNKAIYVKLKNWYPKQ